MIKIKEQSWEMIQRFVDYLYDLFDFMFPRGMQQDLFRSIYGRVEELNTHQLAMCFFSFR